MNRLVGVIGTDGSGKTTLSAALVGELQGAGVSARHEWLGAESYLMAPVRRFLKLLWVVRRVGRRSTAGTHTISQPGYRAEISRKNAVVTRFPWAVSLYITLVLVDYRLQLRRKLKRASAADLVVADRYVFDVAVNLGLVLGWTPAEVVHFLRRQLTRVRLPDVRVFLRVEPEVSMQRKDDIPDIDYLRLRLSYYDAIADAFGFEVRDGARPLDESLAWLVDYTQNEIGRPHIHYVHSNNVDVGGADKVLVRMAQHMGPRGIGRFRVSVSLRLPTDAADMHGAAGTPVLMRSFARPQLSAGTSGLLRFAISGPRTYLYFRRLFGLQQPDLVHVNDVYDFLPAIAAKRLGIPVVTHLRMFQGRPSVRRALARIVSWSSEASVSVSDAVRRDYFPAAPRAHQAEMIHDLGDEALMREQGDVLYPGPRPVDLPQDGLLIVMVGRVEEWKGQAVFLDAVELLDRGVRDAGCFAVVGGPVPGKEDFYADVTARATKLGVLPLGERRDVPELMRAADISVHCSTSPDPFPGVVVESLLAGAATVASRAGGVPEMVDGPGVGVLTSPGDAEELAKVLTDLITATQTPRSRYALAARSRGLTLVDPDPIDRAVSRLYVRILEHQGEPDE